jgi:hypothetical protein
MAQPCPQIVEHLIRDVNSKRFHYNDSHLAIAIGQPNAQAMSRGIAAITVLQMEMGRCARINRYDTG